MMLKQKLLTEKKTRYCQIFFCLSIMPPKGLKSKGGLKLLDNLEKWKNSDLLCLITRLNCLKREEIIL